MDQAHYRNSILRRNEEGAVAVIAAVVFIVLLLMTGAAVELGRIHSEKSKLQAVADAVAYAAVATLPVKTDNAEKIQAVADKVTECVVKNGLPASTVSSIELSGTVSGRHTRVKVVLSTQIDYIFAGVLGAPGRQITESATAEIDAAASTQNMVPLGISRENLINTIATNGFKTVNQNRRSYLGWHLKH